MDHSSQGERNFHLAQDVLFINLLGTAGMFPGQPENIECYMRQSLLGNPSEAGKVPTPVA